MNENETVKQLSDALNQLLNAYENIKEEKNDLNNQISSLKTEIENVEMKNAELNKKIEELNNTTKTHSTEMDSMLSKISNILHIASDEVKKEDDESVKPSLNVIETEQQEPEVIKVEISPVTIAEQLDELSSGDKNNPKEQTDDLSSSNSTNIEDDDTDKISQEIAKSIIKEVEEEEQTAIPNKNSKPLDLGRMQSLLNGMQ